MRAPTAADLLNDPPVQQALEQAWIDSLPGDPAQRHEEGGWVSLSTTTGAWQSAVPPQVLNRCSICRAAC
jgi:hypothetical protein